MAQARDVPGGTRGKSPLPLFVTFPLNFAVVIAGSVQVSAVAAGSSLLAAVGALFDDALGKALDISAATLLCIATAIVWIVARVVYVVLYATGVPVVRTFAWLASIIGLAMMAVRLLS